MTKVLGTENPADLMTKKVAQVLVIKYMAILSVEYQKGRAGAAAQLHTLEEESYSHGEGVDFKIQISNRQGVPVSSEAPDIWAAKGEKG